MQPEIYRSDASTGLLPSKFTPLGKYLLKSRRTYSHSSFGVMAKAGAAKDTPQMANPNDRTKFFRDFILTFTVELRYKPFLTSCLCFCLHQCCKCTAPLGCKSTAERGLGEKGKGTELDEVLKAIPEFIKKLEEAKSESAIAKACQQMKDSVDQIFNKTEGRRDTRSMRFFYHKLLQSPSAI